MNGFVAKRRGVIEHLQDGRLTLLEYGAYDVLIGLAEKSTGIWPGSAKALAATCGAGDLSERQARHVLEALEAKQYIRRFARPRAHGNYPILINKYEVSFGAYAGMRLNAVATTDWRNPTYEPRLEQGAEQGAERAPFRQGQGKGQKKSRVLETAREAHDPRSEEDQRRIVAARDQRLSIDAELRNEIRVGIGPQISGGGVRPEVLERIRRREEERQNASLKVASA